MNMNRFAENNELIPIYNINQFDVVGTGSYLRIKDKVYQRHFVKPLQGANMKFIPNIFIVRPE